MFKTYRDRAETIIFRSGKKGDYPLAALNIATLFFLTVFKIGSYVIYLVRFSAIEYTIKISLGIVHNFEMFSLRVI